MEHVLIEGNSYYYILFERVEGDVEGFDKIVFKVALDSNPYLPFVKAGDRVKVVYEKGNDVYTITQIQILD